MASSSQWIAALLLLSGSALAEVRIGTDYKILTDVTDSAGGRSVGGIYANVGSTTGIAGAQNGGYISQIGNSTFISTIVTNTNDDGPGSLRKVLADAALKPGADIVTFDAGLSGQVIDLVTQIIVSDTAEVVIDATALTGGITLSGAGTSRIMQVSAGTSLQLKGLNLTGGNGSGTHGGAIYTDGILTMTHCAVFGNSSANYGGGIYNAAAGTLTLSHCTISGNSAQYGGGVENYGVLSLLHVTLSGNNGFSGSGGLDTDGSSTTSVRYSVIAGNSAPNGADIQKFGGTISPTPPNLVGINSGAEAEFPAGVLVGTLANPLAPLLAPLGNYGGSTRTMPLLPGSPARNMAVGSTAADDQRHFPIVGIPDLGAYEAGTFTSYPIWIWETLPATADHAEAADVDGDELSNFDEWLALTDPASGASFFGPVASVEGPNQRFTFPGAAGRMYRLEQSDDLTAASWIESPAQPVLAGNGSAQSFVVSRVGVPRRFYRIAITLP